MNKGHIIAIMVLVIAAGFTMWAFSSSTSRYVDIKTAKTTDSVVQLRGKILHKDPKTPAPYYDSKLGALRFWIEDVNQERMEVVYHGAKPDAFDTAPETAAHGRTKRLADGREVFESDNIVVKCPSKYDDKSGKTPAVVSAQGAA